MSELKIHLPDDRTAFELGEEVSGNASWHLEKPPRAIEVRLFWFTRGRGIEDAGVVQTFHFEQPLHAETRSFRFRLPEAPYSFSGQLISLIWAIELIVEPSKEVARQEIVMAPRKQQVQLGSVPSEPGSSSSITWRVGS